MAFGWGWGQNWRPLGQSLRAKSDYFYSSVRGTWPGLSDAICSPPPALPGRPLRVTVERLGEGKEWDPSLGWCWLAPVTLATGQGYVGGLSGKEAAANLGHGLRGWDRPASHGGGPGVAGPCRARSDSISVINPVAQGLG